jgi:hypothetical protein
MWSGRHLQTCSRLVIESAWGQAAIQGAVLEGVPEKIAEELFKRGYEYGVAARIALEAKARASR